MDDKRERQKILHRWFYLQLRMKHLQEEVQGLSKWLTENRKSRRRPQGAPSAPDAIRILPDSIE